MPEATDIQMQQYADQRIRVRAEQARALFAAMADDKAAIDDVYARASGTTPWADARTDGPPSLLSEGDVLVYNTVITAMAKVVNGTALLTDIAAISTNWSAFQTACVRPLA